MKDIKLLFVVNSLSFSGAGKMVHYVAGLFAKEGYNVYAVSLNDSTLTSVDNGVNYYNLALKGGGVKGRINTIRQIRKLVKKITPDVCVSFVSDVAFSSYVATRLMKRPIIVSAERGDPYTLPKIWQFLCKLAYKGSDYCFFQLDNACAFYGDKVRRHSFVIPNAFIPSPVDSNLVKRNKTIVSAGRFEAQKDFELLLQAFAIVHKKHQDYKLIIYGDGSLKNKYVVLCKQLQIDDCVSFPGFVKNISEHIYSAGIFVLSTFYEGIPNVLIEALALGLPSVSSDCSPGGPAFLTDNGRRGLLVPVGDLDKMVDSINRIIEDESLANSLSRSAVEIKEILSPNRINNMWIQAFNRIFDNK